MEKVKLTVEISQDIAETIQKLIADGKFSTEGEVIDAAVTVLINQENAIDGDDWLIV